MEVDGAMTEDPEIVRRCREYLGAQDGTDAEVVAACEGTAWLTCTRLILALNELFRPITDPLRRILK